jgi:hypothetical protein
MIAQLFFQVKHLQKKKQDLETLCVYQIGPFRASARNAKCRMQNKKFSFHRCNEPEEPNGVENLAGLKAH